MKRRDTFALLGVGAAAWLTGCGGSDSIASSAPGSTGAGVTGTTTTNGTTDLVTLAQSDPELSILVEAVVSADLGATLKGTGPFTLFAPVNAAFSALLLEIGLTKAELLADKALLTQVLTYHVLAAKVERAQIPAGKAITSVQGGVFKVDNVGGSAAITDGRNRNSTILAIDRQASNGVLHTIDRVLLPANKTLLQTAQALPQFSTLVEAVMAANLQDALSAAGPLTVFAPTNDAFAKLLTEINVSKEALLASGPLLADILRYHVVAGRVLKADVPIDSPITTLEGSTFTIGSDLMITDQLLRSSRISTTDVLATNGVIHVVDQVLLHQVMRP